MINKELPVGYLVPQGERNGKPHTVYLSPDQFDRALAYRNNLDPRATHLPIGPELLRARAIYARN